MQVRSGERGFLLILVLILLGVGSLVLGPMLNLATTGLKGKQVRTDALMEQYARDAGAEFALWDLLYGTAAGDSIQGDVTETVTLNGVQADITIKMRADQGLSGVGLARDDQIKPTKEVTSCVVTATQQAVDCNAVPADTPMTFTYTITLERLEPDDANFDLLNDIVDVMDYGFEYVADSGQLDGVPFNDNDLNPPLKEPVIVEDAPLVLTPELTSVADAMVKQASPSTNYGTDTSMDVRSASGSGNIRALVRFDLSSLPIPSGSTVKKAELRLWGTGVPGNQRTYDVYRVTQSWDEANVTWSNQPSVAGSPSDNDKTPDNPNKEMKWDLKADVQDFIDGTATNYGWLIRDRDEDSGTAYTTTFVTREGTIEQTPLLKLEIEYDPPGGSGYKRITWKFQPKLYFEYGEKRTLSFQATATLEADTRYCNAARVKPHDSYTGLTAPITVGTPPYPGCPGSGIEVTKTSDITVIPPGVPTVVTYVIRIANMDIGDFRKFDSIEDWLPPGFTYVDNSATASWSAENSTDNPEWPYNICDFEPEIEIETDGRQKLKWHKQESANGFNPGVELCHDYPLPQGAVYTQTFQATALLDESGSYYNEVFVKLKDVGAYGGDRDIGDPDRAYSWPTAGAVVPMYDVKSDVPRTTGQGNVTLDWGTSEVTLNSWNVE